MKYFTVDYVGFVRGTDRATMRRTVVPADDERQAKILTIKTASLDKPVITSVRR